LLTLILFVQIHFCGGSAQIYNWWTKFDEYADEEGFIVIYPSTTHHNSCWDVSNNGSLVHDGGGDSLGIVQMVNYTLSKYDGDRSKVFMVGTSSGAIMTNNLAGAYPDIFAGGASFSGWPYGCWTGSWVPSPSPDPTYTSDPTGLELSCPNGTVVRTPQEWADIVHSAYPGYTGRYPKMALFHGTNDTVVNYQNMIEEIKQWTAIHNVTFSNNVTDIPGPGFVQSIYGDGTEVVAFTAVGAGHVVPVQEETVLRFFGLLSDE
jgi:acetylxylan esterase